MRRLSDLEANKARLQGVEENLTDFINLIKLREAELTLEEINYLTNALFFLKMARASLEKKKFFDIDQAEIHKTPMAKWSEIKGEVCLNHFMGIKLYEYYD